jgi:hypothetical protein
VKGGTGAIVEYHGPGTETISAVSYYNTPFQIKDLELILSLDWHGHDM